MKKTKLLDTNIIIRFLTSDSPEEAEKVEQLLKKAKKEELEIPDFILTEIVWVLLSFYQLTKEQVIEKLKGILVFEKFKLNRVVFRKAIDFYSKNNVSFVDSYLWALASQNKHEGFYTFDKKLKKAAGRYAVKFPKKRV